MFRGRKDWNDTSCMSEDSVTTKAHLILSNYSVCNVFTAIILCPSQMIISFITPYVIAELILEDILTTLPALYSTPRTITE